MADEGMLGILRKIHPRHVIWALLVMLTAVIGFVGKKYGNAIDGSEKRVEALEKYKIEQNGHLKDIDQTLKAMRETMTEMRSEQIDVRADLGEVLIEQKAIKTDMEWIKREVSK